MEWNSDGTSVIRCIIVASNFENLSTVTDEIRYSCVDVKVLIFFFVCNAEKKNKIGGLQRCTVSDKKNKFIGTSAGSWRDG